MSADYTKLIFPNHANIGAFFWATVQKRIANTGNIDYDAAEAMKRLLGEGPNKAKKDLEDWEVEEFKGKNILFYKGKNYILNDSQLWHDIVQKYHDHLTARHPGELQTFNVVKEHYWWPGLQVFVKNYIQGCRTCCYELFSFSTCVCHAFYFSFSFTNYMHFPQGWHAFIHILTSFLPYVLHVFTTRWTPALYLFKSVVEHLYSLAIHWESYHS